jgi:FixJ family two-component response regulator
MKQPADNRSRIIWIIDANHWERVNIRALLIERGFQVEGFVSIFHAVSSLFSGIFERPAVIVFERKKLVSDPAELDEVFRVGAPVVLLTGVFEADCEIRRKYEWAAILCRPFTVGQVADAVEAVARC